MDDVDKQPTTVRLDDELLNAIRREAARRGTSEDEVIEAAVRRYVAPSVLDRLWDRNQLDEDEAMRIAVEETAAVRAAKRSR